MRTQDRLSLTMLLPVACSDAAGMRSQQLCGGQCGCTLGRAEFHVWPCQPSPDGLHGSHGGHRCVVSHVQMIHQVHVTKAA